MTGLRWRIRVTTSLDKELWDKFKKLSAETRIPISKLFDEAIEDALKKYGK